MVKLEVLDHMASFLAWPVQLGKHLHLLRCVGVTVLYVDNYSVIKDAKRPEFPARTKHIAVWPHHIRELIEEDVIRVQYVPSELQIADILTKVWLRDCFGRLQGSKDMHEGVSTSI